LGLDQSCRSQMIWRIGIFIITGIVAAVLGVWAADRDPPYILQNGVAAPSPAVPGGPLYITSDVIVYRSGCYGVFQRTMLDSGGFPWAFPPTPTQFNDLPPGKYRVATPIRYILPVAIASGEACSSTETTFYCNPLHKLWPIKVHTACVKFTVAPR
jgi:hypothetical protein